MPATFLLANRLQSLSFAAILLASVAGMAQADDEPNRTGHIRGQLVDERNQVTYVGQATVFLCDAESGLPILRKTKRPLDPGKNLNDAWDMWYELTTDRGSFEFADVPVGKYRLVAQSWSGTVGVPKFQDKPSTLVLLHGIAENVEVKAGETTVAYPRKLGDATLKIVNDPEEPHAFLFISLQPRLGDGVLGPAGWGKKFLAGLIAVTQMERPYVTLVGLPAGKEIHVGLFNYDNNPGVGGDSYLVGKEPTVRLNIYATWSNGKYEPPPRLARLTDYLSSRTPQPRLCWRSMPRSLINAAHNCSNSYRKSLSASSR